MPDEPISGSAEEICEMGGRLLEEGDALRAAEAFSAAAVRRDGEEAGRAAVQEDPADPVRGRALAGLGIARLELALAAFREAAEWAGPDVRPLAVELLARALPLRDRDTEAAQAWRWGLEDPDPEVAASVRARLRRSFEAGTGNGAARPWWDGFLESAVCHGTLPLLAAELFAALDHLYAMVAVSYTRGGTRGREVHDALAEAVRLPGGYAWGADLQDSFRRRLRDATGADADVLPASWPDG